MILSFGPDSTRFVVPSGVDIEQVELARKSVTREDCVPRFLQIDFRGTAARR